MDLILSLIVYIGTALLLALLGWHVNQREQRLVMWGGAELPFATWEVMMSLCIYIAVSSFRWLMSWDYNQYYSYYVSMQSLGDYSRENYEPGFHLVTVAMGRAGLHYAFYFGLWAALHITLLYYALRHRKCLLPWVALFIFLGPYYIQWMSLLRQAVVECLFVLMVELIVRRKFWIYLLVSLLALSIHKMALLLIPLYLVPLIKVKSMRRWVPFALLLLCVVLGMFPQWIKWGFDRIGQLASLLGYGHYYRLFNTDVSYAFRSVIGPTRLFPLLTGFIILWYYPAIKSMFARDKYLSAIYRFMLVHLCYINVMGNTTQYLSRPGDLMRGAFLIMVCYTMCYLWRERKWLPVIIIACMNFYYIFYELIKSATIGGSIYAPELYRTFLF